jgi:hypothetical protein
MDDIQQLGTATATWAIKDFSVALRQEITRAARQADCTVAEWLHGHFQRFGVGEASFSPVKLDPVKPSPSAPPTAEPAATVTELAALLETAVRFEEVKDRLPQRTRAALSRRLKAAVTSGGPPAREYGAGRKMLPPPED